MISSYDTKLGQSVTSVSLKATIGRAEFKNSSNPQNIHANVTWAADGNIIAQYNNMLLNYDQNANQFYNLLSSDVWGGSLGKLISVQISSNNLNVTPIGQSYFVGIVAEINSQKVN